MRVEPLMRPGLIFGLTSFWAYNGIEVAPKNRTTPIMYFIIFDKDVFKGLFLLRIDPLKLVRDYQNPIIKYKLFLKMNRKLFGDFIKGLTFKTCGD